VMLVETDRLHAEPSRGGFRCFFQVLRPTVERPAAIRRTDVGAFGGDKNVGGVAAVAGECARDQVSLWPTSSWPTSSEPRW
jgi:hypothetical protein